MRLLPGRPARPLPRPQARGSRGHLSLNVDDAERRYRLEPSDDLVQSPSFYHRVAAAAFAVRAGIGASRDDPPPDDAARAGLRRQALTWLRAEFADWLRRCTPGRPETRRRAVTCFQNWKNEPRFAGVRDPRALKALPADERAAWHAFWADLDAQIGRP